MNAIFLLSCLVILRFGVCDKRRAPALAAMAVGVGFVLLFPMQGDWSYIQHATVELSILITLINTRSPWYYLSLMALAFISHLTMLYSYNYNPTLFYFFNPIYKLILPCIYTLFLMIATKTEGALFSWWPPKSKKRARWTAKELHDEPRA